MHKEFKPYIPVNTEMREISFKAILLGIIMAVILGAANVYIGMTAGMTVAATFPAAVISMAVLRIFRGSVLEENLARTTGAVGEALAAGAVFVIPAFVISGVWTRFDYLKSTVLMLVGGILGVLFVIMLRKTLIEDQTLPYPESRACAEIVKAGQSGSTGAGLVFGTMGIAALIELFRNSNGITFIRNNFKGFFKLGTSKISLLNENAKVISAGDRLAEFKQDGGILLQSPAARSAFLGVGYIIGFRLASITFAGGVFGWLFLMPVVLFIMSGDISFFAADSGWIEIAKATYDSTVKPIAVGGMLVGAFYTLFSMRKSLISGLSKGFKDIKKAGKSKDSVSRVDKDAPFGMVVLAILILVVSMIVIFQQVIKTPDTSGWGGAVLSAVVMALAGLLFAAVAGYLVGIIGSSSNPISGLALTSLLIAALLMVGIGLKGDGGILATLAVASVVACVAGVSGDMMQDWKAGYILGGTPWKMQLGGIIGVVAAALILVLPIMLLHRVSGIGSEDLPAPQAGLMSMMAKGIVGGEMAWPLVLGGMFFTIALILLKSPSPMLIAVGMYLPFPTTFAIFIGGIVKYFTDEKVNKTALKKAKEGNLEGEEKAHYVDRIKEKAENFGLLLASGFVAGEAITGILLAGVFALKINLNGLVGNLSNEEPVVSNGIIGSILYFIVMAFLVYLMIRIPMKNISKQSSD